MAIEPLDPQNRAKDDRIEKAQPAVNAGLWHIAPGMEKQLGETPNLLGQLFQWPFSRKRDRADAFAYFEDAWLKFPVERVYEKLEDDLLGEAEPDWNDDSDFVAMMEKELYGGGSAASISLRY